MTGFWPRSILCVSVYRPPLYLGPSSRKKKTWAISSLLWPYVWSVEHTLLHKNISVDKMASYILLYRSYKLFLFSSLFLKMLALTLTWIGPYWIISCKIVTFLVSPTPLMFCLVYLRLFSGNLLQNWLQVRRGFPKPSLVPITPGTGNKCYNWGGTTSCDINLNHLHTIVVPWFNYSTPTTLFNTSY